MRQRMQAAARLPRARQRSTCHMASNADQCSQRCHCVRVRARSVALVLLARAMRAPQGRAQAQQSWQNNDSR